MLLCLIILLFINCSKQETLRRFEEPVTVRPNLTRRILNGKHAGNTRPYMVYLRQAQATPGAPPADPNWLCGGVIIHPRYILTSAACIQDVPHFYVIAGFKRWASPSNASKCVSNGRRKAVAKFVHKSYIYDGGDFNNIRWMANDIAIVKVDEEFNFKRRVIGCCYIPQMVAFNNQSADLEKPRTEVTIAGWGTREKFSEVGISKAVNARYLQESKLYIITKKNCKKGWPERYHYIIDGKMICARDAAVRKTTCDPKDKKCPDKDPDYSYEDGKPKKKTLRNLRHRSRRTFKNDSLIVHTAAHGNATRRASLNIGGFCENDHGGPLMVGRGKRSVVIGVITACLMQETNQRCHGPFLFTSVWQNRHLINCVINDETGGKKCQDIFESRKIGVEQTNFDWSSIPDGSPKEDFAEEPLSHSEEDRDEQAGIDKQDKVVDQTTEGSKDVPRVKAKKH